jgi:hypothetical protein
LSAIRHVQPASPKLSIETVVERHVLQLFLNCGLLFALLKTVLLSCSIFVSCIWFGNLRDEAARGFWFGLARWRAHFCELTALAHAWSALSVQSSHGFNSSSQGTLHTSCVKGIQ